MCRWCISVWNVWNTLSKKTSDERRDLVCCFVECEVAGIHDVGLGSGNVIAISECARGFERRIVTAPYHQRRGSTSLRKRCQSGYDAMLVR